MDSISALDVEIQALKEKVARLEKLRLELQQQYLGKTEDDDLTVVTQSPPEISVQRSGRTINDNVVQYYSLAKFEWSRVLLRMMQKVFEFPSFKPGQEGVCNALLDGRDVVCVMPTAGGKSLTYQLVALLTPGCTLVISPLISLMMDQIEHLHEVGVEAVMMTASTPPEVAKQIERRLLSANSSRSNAGDSAKDIKLFYVTPEKVAKSPPFKALLKELAKSRKLARVVVDEAQCIAEHGLDFRADYRKLSDIRLLLPDIPILALSATCPPIILDDVVKVLRLPPIVSQTSETSTGTVYFTTPLFRRNLVFEVVPKLNSAKAVIHQISEYILTNAKGKSGIIYCATKKESVQVADGLYQASKQKIKTAVYNSELNEDEKRRVHVAWRSGKIQVVVATTAFGLGIDKSDVRFVIHHTMPRSIDALYQEAGRAGRGQNKANCIVFYRPQDVSRLAAPRNHLDMISVEKLLDVVRFCQDSSRCRHSHFATYFMHSSLRDLPSDDDDSPYIWDAHEWQLHTALPDHPYWGDENGAMIHLTRDVRMCGHCDNCKKFFHRFPQPLVKQDVTIQAWQIVSVVEMAAYHHRRVTVKQVAQIAMGKIKDAFDVVSSWNAEAKGVRNKVKTERGESTLASEMALIKSGKVPWRQENIENLVLELLLQGFLKMTFHSNSYGTTTYIIPGTKLLSISPRIEWEHRAASETWSTNYMEQRILFMFPNADDSTSNGGSGKPVGAKLAKEWCKASNKRLREADDDEKGEQGGKRFKGLMDRTRLTMREYKREVKCMAKLAERTKRARGGK